MNTFNAVMEQIRGGLNSYYYFFNFVVLIMLKFLFYNVLIWLGLVGCIGGLFVSIGVIMLEEYITLVFTLPTMLISFVIFRWAENKDRGLPPSQQGRHN